MNLGSEIPRRSLQDANTQARPEGRVQRELEGCLEDQTALEDTVHKASHLKREPSLAAKKNLRLSLPGNED